MNDSGSKQSFIDKITGLVNKNDQAPKPVDPGALENVRTQSMVISEHEEAEQELKRLELERQRQAHNVTIEAGVENAKKTGVYIIITIICLILVALIAVLVFTMIPFFRKPSGTDIHIDNGGNESTTIGFYKCLSSECKELTTLSNGNKLVYDGNYIVLDQENEESFTTAMSGNYVSAESFVWGEVEYVFAKQDTGTGAIFSITNNRYLNTSENYEQVFTDIEDDVYEGQRWVEGQYLIVKRSGDYRLIEIASGKEVVLGAKAVFVTQGGLFVGYDLDGKKRIFNNANSQIALVESGKVYVRDTYLIIVYEGGNFDIYNQNGEKPQDYEFKAELESIKNEERQAALDASKDYAVIPD